MGERVWCMAAMPGGFTLPGTQDSTRPNALLTTTHDGTGACRILFTAVRVVCQNTLNIASAARSAWSIRHTGNTDAALQDARHAMNEAAGLFADRPKVYQERAHALAAAQCSRENLRAYLLNLIPDNGAAKTTHARTENIRAEIGSLALHGKGNDADGIRGTWFAALNGVMEYVDHKRSARGSSEAEKGKSRFEAATFGSGASLKAEALDLALEMAGASN